MKKRVSYVDVEALNCDVFNPSVCVDGDSMPAESVEEEVACKTLLIFPFVCLVISVLLNVCVPSFIIMCV